MTIRIDVTEVGLARSVRAFDSMGRRTRNLYPVMQYIAQDFERVMEDQFDSEGASTGTEWAPLSDDWWEHKVNVGKDHGTLQYNQKLVQSLTDSGAPGAIRDVSNNEVTMGTSVPYAIFHIEGTGRMPRRNFMRIPANTQRHWVAVLNRYIMTGRMYR
jgi:phage gpG-like protein